MDGASLIFEAIGTAWRIDSPEELTAEVSEGLVALIEDYDKSYSRFRADSLVSEMARKAGIYRLPENAKPLFDLYETAYGLTAGAVTPLIGVTLESAGYDASYSLKPENVEAPPTWGDTLEYSFPMITLKQPALLDLGAAGKGYLVDLVGEYLHNHGLRAFCVDASGDIRTYGRPERIGLEDPRDASKAIGIVTMNEGSLCGSSHSRRAWEGYSHILDPVSLKSPTHILATWVTAKTALLADMLATCLFFVKPERLSKAFAFEYLVLTDNGETVRSPAFPGELFT